MQLRRIFSAMARKARKMVDSEARYGTSMRVVDSVCTRALTYAGVSLGVGMAVPASLYAEGVQLGFMFATAADATITGARLAARAIGTTRTGKPRTALNKPRHITAGAPTAKPYYGTAPQPAVR